MKTHDGRKRRYPNQRQPKGKRLNVPKVNSPRFNFLKKLSWFEALPSSHCVEIMHNEGIGCRTGARNVLRDFYHEKAKGGGNYLDRPEWQLPNAAWIARNHHYIQSIGDAGVRRLGALYQKVSKDAHHYHGLMNSIIAAETMIEHEKNRENTYIPNHKVSDKANEYAVSFDVNGETFKYVLKPDNRCILDYGGKQVLVFDEVDRNTEQTSGNKKGKQTLEKKLRAYRALLAHSNFPSGRKALYQEILGTELPAMVRFHFTSKGAMQNVMEILNTLTDKKGAKNFLFKHHEGRFDGRERYMAPMHSPETYREYLRVVWPTVDLSNPDTF